MTCIGSTILTTDLFFVVKFAVTVDVVNVLVAIKK